MNGRRPRGAASPEWAIACLDRVCINCWCGQSLNDELDDDRETCTATSGAHQMEGKR